MAQLIYEHVQSVSYMAQDNHGCCPTQKYDVLGLGVFFLPALMSMHHMRAVPTETRRGFLKLGLQKVEGCITEGRKLYVGAGN